jgi:ankyrin repeat protein
MATLPAHPNLDHLRRQARDLLRAVRAGDVDAAHRLGSHPDQATLAVAQRAIAREYGFPSWPRLKAEVATRTADLAEKAEAFCRASVGDWTGRAARMLAATPEIASFDVATAVVVGDADRVRLELGRDPELATRRDPRSGWTALHLVSGSRWHVLDPSRADGLVAVARLLLDAGADLDATTSGLPRRGGGRTALRCASASASTSSGNELLIRVLLERGAVIEDHDLYLVAFGNEDQRCLRLLLEFAGDVAETARMALAAPVSQNDAAAVRLLLDAGADPRRYHDDEQQPASAVYEAVAANCSAELVELLLAYGADPNAHGDDGRTPYQRATSQGRGELVELLHRYGASEDASDAERLQFAALRADRSEAERQLERSPGLRADLAAALGEAGARAAETGNSAALALMLDLGFPVNGDAGEDGATALHVSAYAGSPECVRLLLERGADIEARETNWNSTPLIWAIVGSGEKPRHNAAADWTAVVEALLDAGAATHEITFSPDDPKRPSAEVAKVLRDYGVGSAYSD